MSYLGQAPGQGMAEYFLFTASGSETSVTTADDGRPVAYTVGQVSVYLNGVRLVEGSGKDFQATNGSSITGLSALTASDVVEVVALSTFSPADTVSAANGGTFNGNVSFGDNNITNVGDISLDTISSDAGTSIGVTLGTDAGDDFNVGSGKLLVEGDTGLVSIGTGGDFETSTTGKIKQKGSFMQSSTHQAMVLGG